MKRASLVSALGILALQGAGCGPVVPEEEAEAAQVGRPELGTQTEELICGSEDWNDIAAFAGDESHRIGAHYGKAIGSLNGGACTGVLYSDRWLLTANHCRPSNDTVSVTFGGFVVGSATGRNRLLDLGVWSGNLSGLSDSAFSTFTCNFHKTFNTSTYGYRDVDVYRCNPNELPDIGLTFPGDVWGFTQMEPGTRSEQSGVYAVTYNKATFYSAKRVLLSPNGEVHDADDGCVLTEDYEHCFEHDADTRGGSSGGAIFDKQSHRLFGLVHGNYGVEGWSCPSFATNYGSYLASASYHPDSVPALASQPAASAVWAPHVGGTGGTAKWVSCPEGYLAAGVVGTTYPFDTSGTAPVGNLGLVCVPYNLGSAQIDRSSRHWRVAVGGSYDTGFQSGTFPFNEYIHETLDLLRDDGTATTFADQEQSLTMCRPGFFLTGLRVHASTFLDRVVELECTQSAYVWQKRVPRKALGTRSSTETVVRCPDSSGTPRQLPDRAVYGMNIHSGWLTDGFKLACRRF